MSVEEQKKELLKIINLAEENNLTTLFLQVRPTADALYLKSKEPWSFWLTGKQGKAPEPLYDPLEFAIEECHNRGIELHAWVNPFRISMGHEFEMAENHPIKEHPDWVLKYGSMNLFNPGNPDARKYIIETLLYLCTNYDLDGLHLDDYFYPYPKARTKLRDKETYQKYNTGFENISDWRRNNVNVFVRDLSDSLRKNAPRVKLGISPFAIWDNADNNPRGSKSRGLSGYRDLYADVVLWMQKGWIDYVTPQLYTYHGNKNIPYENMLNWWSENKFGHHLYVGLGVYKFIHNKSPYNMDELTSQIAEIRSNECTEGLAFYNTNSFEKLVKKTFYKERKIFAEKTLPPPMPWIDSIPPLAVVEADKIKNGPKTYLRWLRPPKADDGEYPKYYIIYYKNKDTNQVKIKEIVPFNQFNTILDTPPANIGVGIQSVDKLFNVSQIVYIGEDTQMLAE